MAGTEAGLTEETVEKVAADTAEQTAQREGPGQGAGAAQQVEHHSRGSNHDEGEDPGDVLTHAECGTGVTDRVPPQKPVNDGDALPQLHLGNNQVFGALVDSEHDGGEHEREDPRGASRKDAHAATSRFFGGVFGSVIASLCD